jgi:hypothetical protein
MKNVSDKSLGKIDTHILCSITFFENRAVYEIMCKNIVEPDRPQMTIWRMRIARWITKATHTHSQYVILTAFPLQQWLHERTCLLRHTYFACLVQYSFQKFPPSLSVVLYALLVVRFPFARHFKGW